MKAKRVTGNGSQRVQSPEVIDLLTCRRERLTLFYRDTHPWDSGFPGHLAALLGCSRTIEESVGEPQPSPERLATLRYGFMLRRARVEKALNALAEGSSASSGFARVLDSIHELNSVLERLHQVGYGGHPILARAATQLARQVNDQIWFVLFEASPNPAMHRI